jgi:hypothetical protein
MRESGVVRFLLGNSPAEVEASRPYMTLARTQLGITKNLMKLGGLPSYTRTVELEDGTVIRCQSVMGQDAIAIVPAMRVPARPRQETPATPVRRKRRKVEEISTTEYGWFQLPDGPPKNGHQAVWDDTNKRMLMWGGYDRPGMDIPAAPRVGDWDDDTVWEARPGGTVRYAAIVNHTFDVYYDAPDYLGGLPTSTWWATNWYAISGGSSIGEGPRTGADLVTQLYIGDTWQDKADAVRYDMPRDPLSSSRIDMLPSTALWQFEFTGGVPWAGPGQATAGVWTQLANISYNDWQAIVTAAIYVDISIDNAWVPDRGDAMNQVTYAGWDFYDAAASAYYTGYTGDDYFELYFGGTITGADTSMSKQLWMYGPIVSVTERVYEEDDPNP